MSSSIKASSLHSSDSFFRAQRARASAPNRKKSLSIRKRQNKSWTSWNYKKKSRVATTNDQILNSRVYYIPPTVNLMIRRKNRGRKKIEIKMNGIRPESIMTINDGGSRLNNSQSTNTLRCCEFQLNPFDSAASSKQKTSDQFIIDISPLSLLIWRVAGQTSGAPFFTFSFFFFLPFFY